MNKLRYRIVFNKTRGMCMAVAETARSQGKGAAGMARCAVPPVMRMTTVRRLVVLLGAGLGGLTLGGGALAQVVADPHAPGQQRATVLNTGNGVLQVNVQTPSAAGVSRNVYSQFDVPKSGVVLNNARTDVQTQLGGWVQANPWMTQGTARVILNEVNSSNPSRLQGYIEVAGDRAETVIANPAGIVVDGGGFINVSRATLTTGSPRLEDGRLAGYSVQRGQIVVEGAGLDARTTDYTALIARAVQLNAGVWAQHLDLIAGVNEVTPGEGSPAVQARQAADAAPRYAIDVAQLGGMYANEIFMVGTEAGVGVRNAGAIGATAGDLVVTASGRLENTGTLSASQGLSVQAAAIENRGTVQSAATLTLHADSLLNSGQIRSASEALVTVQGEVDNSGGHIEAPRIELTSATLRNAGGSIVQTGTSVLNVDASQVVNAGGTLGRQTTPASDGAGGTVAQPSNGAVGEPASGSAGTGTVAAPADSVSAGTGGTTPAVPAAPAPVVAPGLLKTGSADNSDGLITANGGVTVNTGPLDNRGGQAYLDSLSVTGPAFDNTAGTLTVVHGFSASADSFVNDHGKLLVGASFDAGVGRFSNRQGLLQAGQLDVGVTGALDNSGGTLRQLGAADAVLRVGGDLGMDHGALEVAAGLRLNAGSISGSGSAVNVGGDLAVESGATSAAQGKWVVGGAASLQTGDFDNRGGAISAGGTVAMSTSALANGGGIIAAGADAAITAADAVDNAAGTIQAARDLTLAASGAVGNQAGTIETLSKHSQLNLRGTSIANDGGRIANAGDGNTTISASTVNNGGRISGNGDVAIVARTLNNTSGAAITSLDDMDMKLSGTLANDGNISAGKDLGLAASGRIDNGGTISAAGSLDARAGGAFGNQGSIVANNGLAIRAGSLDNDHGTIEAAGAGATLALRAGAIRNGDGRILNLGTGATTVTASDSMENRGQVAGNGRLDLSAADLDNEAGGTLASGTAMTLAIGTRMDNAGTVNSGAALDIAARGAAVRNAGVMVAQGGLALEAGAFDNDAGQLATAKGSGAALRVDAGSISNRAGAILADRDAQVASGDGIENAGGILQAGGSLGLDAGGRVGNDGGAIEALDPAAMLALHAGTVDNGSGRVVDAGNGATTITVDGKLSNCGLVAGKGTLDMTVADLDNQAGGSIAAGAALTLAASRSITNAGTIAADGDARVTTGATFDNHAGTFHASRALAIDAGGALGNQDGVIEATGAGATLDMHAASIDNSGGHLVNVGNGTTRIRADGDILNSGTLAGNGAVDMSAATVHNQAAGTLAAGATLDVHAGQAVENAGTVSAAGALTIDEVGARIANSGQIAAAGRVLLHGASIANDGGQIATEPGADLDLHSESTLSNRAGNIAAAGNATLAAVGAYDNSNGQVQASGSLQVTTGGTLTNNGGALEAVGAASTLGLQAAAIDNTAGRIVNAGSGGTALTSASSILNSGTIAGNGALDIDSLGLQNKAGGAIGAGGALELAVRQQLDNQGGTISAGTTLHIDQAGASFSNSGRIGAGGTVDINAASIANDGGQLYTVNSSGGAILLRTASLSNSGGTIAADGLLQAGVDAGLTNDGGTLHGGRGTSIGVGGALVNGSGTIEAATGALGITAQSLGSSGHIVNAGSGVTTLTSAGAIVNSGTIAGNGTLDVHAATLQNQAAGRVASGGALLLDVNQQLTNAGAVSSAGTLTFDQAGASFSNNGQIAAAGDAVFTAASFDNDGGRISTVKGSGAAIRVTAPALSNRAGAILADGDATFAFASGGDNSLGTLQAGVNLALTTAGTVSNAGGVIEAVGGASTLSLEAASIDNGNGRISNMGSGDTRLTSDTTIANGGVIAAAGKLVLSAQMLQNQLDGSIASGGDVALAITQQLANQGKINSDGTLTFNQAGATFSNSGQVFAGGNAVITARLVDNSGGQLGTGSGSGADLALTTDQLSNQGGRIVSDRDLIISTHTVAATGELFGGRDLTLTMDGDFIQGGAQQVRANRDLSLTTSGNITNTSTLGAVGTLTLSGQQISNQAGATLEGQGVVLRASGDLSNAGEIDGANTVDISAANVGNSGGIVGANVSVATGNLDNTGSAALVGASASLGLGVDGTLNNTGGATLYSSGDMAIGGHAGGSTGTVNNVSSTIEAGGSLALDASTLNNIRENVQIVQVKTVDETVHMSMPSWDKLGDNHESYETTAANYYPHDVYFVKRSDILEDQEYITPDGYTIHRAVVQTHANDSAFFVAGTGLNSAYGAQQRLTLSEGTLVIYYSDKADAANPDQGGPASNVLSLAPWVTHWTSTVSFSDQYGDCGSDCVRLVAQPGYDDPRTTINRDTVRSLASVREKLEASRDAHHTAVEDQLAPGAGAVAEILAGGNMYLTVGSALNNQYGDIKAQGTLNIPNGAAITNVGATLYRTHTFDGTWTTVDGEVVAYQQPSISEVIGSSRGVIDGEQGVSIAGRSFSNVDVTAGTVGNIRDAVHVIGSGASGAASAGAQVTAGTVAGGTADVSAAGSASGNHAGLASAANAVGDSGLAASLMGAGSGVTNGLQAGGRVSDSGDMAAPGDPTRQGMLAAPSPSAAQQASHVQGAAFGSVMKVAPSGLFIRNPDPNGSYLYETRPQFADQQQWTSSDYLLNQLALDPTVTQKRLGDGFYEQRLVREQLSDLTGRAPDVGASDDAQYKQLLTNAVSAAREFGLRPGVALSADQVSQLTSDIVWMESQTVMLPDGTTQTVLVPKVYLAHVGEQALQPSGALVTGKGVSINVSDSIVNQGGVIDGGEGRTLLIAGQDIVNQGGTIKGGSVALAAGGDIKNESLAVKQSYDFGQNSGSTTSLSNVATIAATGSLDMMAGRDLIDLAGKISAGSATLSAGRNVDFNTIQTGSSYQSQISGYTEKDSSITHQLSQISTTGDLKIAAMGNLNLTGTQVSIGTAGTGAGQLLAGGTINIAAVTDEVKTAIQNDPSSKQYDKQVHDNQTVVGAGVNAAGSLVVRAGMTGSGALNVSGSNLSAGDALALGASDSVNIVSVQESHLSDTASTRSSSSVFKSKTTQQADYVASSQAIGSSVSGKTVDISAGKDINVLGSAVAGDGDVSLAAAGSVNIGASTSTLTEQHHTEVKDSGFLSGGGFGISYGTRTTTTDQQRDATTQSGQSRSMVGSIGGNLNIVAGDAIRVSGSDLAAGLDMALIGRSVTIDPGQDNSKGKSDQKTVQDGLTLAVGGSVVNAIQTFGSMSSAASQSKSSRVQALAAATAAMAAKSAADDIAKNGVNVSLSLTVGHSESQYTQTTSDLQNSGSVLNAGKDIMIRASGAGQDSNISIVGSNLNAHGNVALKADNQVNLLAAQDLESQHSDSKSMSAAAGIGVTVGTQGTSYGFTASASVGRGSEDGEGVTQLNTHVTAGQALVIDSGGDTNIKGAVASGTQVVANVGGNLNIESLQDTAKFDSKNESLSVNGTVGVGASVSGSASQSKVHNDYASVQEQSGIRAGDGGFQVTVGGNTDLKGGVISSSAAGVAANILTTATLTHSDIENKATTSGSSIGISGGATVAGTAEKAAGKDDGGIKLANMGASGAGVTLPGAVAISSNESGTTLSGIGAGKLVITDNAAQIALTGQSATQAAAGVKRDVGTGSDTSGRIANNFDANAANATLAVTSEFAGKFTSLVAPVAANIVGDIGAAKQKTAQAQADEYQRLATNAAARGDTAAAQAYVAQEADARAAARAWSDNGVDRLALHAATQGLIGGIAGGSAGALSGISGVAGGNLGQQLGKKLGEDEADRQGLQGQTRNDLINTYQQTFAAVGGAVAGLATSAANGGAAPDGLMGAAQAANTGNIVDVFNRQLHPGDFEVAQTLAALSKGKYSEQEIEAALRHAGLRSSSGTTIVPEGTAEIFVNNVNIRTGTTLQDTYNVDPNLPIGSGDAKTLLEATPTRPGNELISYILSNTGGTKSPYILTPGLAYTSAASLPPAPEGTSRATMSVDGAVYHPLVASCPAASCMSWDSIAFGIQDPGTSAYLSALSRRDDKYFNIATGVLGVGGAALRGVSALAEAATSGVVAAEVPEAVTAYGTTVSDEIGSLRSLAKNNGGVIPGPGERDLTQLEYNTLMSRYRNMGPALQNELDSTIASQEYVYRATTSNAIDIYRTNGFVGGRAGGTYMSTEYVGTDVGTLMDRGQVFEQWGEPEVLLRIPTTELSSAVVPRPLGGKLSVGWEPQTLFYPKAGAGGQNQFLGATKTWDDSWIIPLPPKKGP